MVSVNYADRSLQVIQPKMQARLDNGREHASALLDQLTRDHITDEIGRFGPKNGDAEGRLEIGYDTSRGVVAVTLDGGGRWRSFHPHAVTQLAERLHLPGAWTRGQMDGPTWQREVVADLISSHLAHTTERDRFLLRSVGDQVRAVLSDSYRRLNSAEIARAFQQAIEPAGLVPYEAKADDLRWHVRAMLARPLMVESKAHGVEYVGVGLRLASSDFGAGALDMMLEILRLACINGCTSESALRQVHLGTKLPANLTFAEDTYAADTRTQALAIRDMVPQLGTPDAVLNALLPVVGSMDQPIEDTAEAVAGLVRAKRIGKEQAETVERLIMDRDGSIVPAGPVTRWTLSQAVSALGNAEGLDIQGATDLRRTAHRIALGNGNG